MKILIIHPDANLQPVAAYLAQEIMKGLPPDAEPVAFDSPEADQAELVIAVFSLKPNTFAPLVPAFRALKDKKVAFVGVITGPVDFGRLRKCTWGTKKQFCGNQVMAGYFCPAEDHMGQNPTEKEVAKVVTFAHLFYQEQAALEDTPTLAVNF